MQIIISALIILVSALHLYFLVLEMFMWTKPMGLKVFRQSLAQAKVTSVLAGNQGLYNGFLCAGLVWSLIHGDVLFATQLQVFFLGCVLIAGVYGAATVNKRIFFIQGLPALITLILIYLDELIVK